MTEKEAQQMDVQDRFWQLSIDLLEREVTIAIPEETFWCGGCKQPR